MKRCVLLMAAFAFLATSPARAAEETWKGTISDSMCAAKHSADKHGDKAADHRIGTAAAATFQPRSVTRAALALLLG